MPNQFFVASAIDQDRIYSFANEFLSKRSEDATAFMFDSWTAAWRKESLEHYLKCGWSFVATSPSDQVVGFFLAQPLLFLNRQTQSLWVEMILGVDQEITEYLIEIAIKTAREKHLQRVLFADFSKNKSYLEKFQVRQQINDIGEWNYLK